MWQDKQLTKQLLGCYGNKDQ